MISGIHFILYSADAEADKAFFRDVLNLPNVDAGRGWLIFGLPPAELAVHPSGEGGPHEMYLMCDDIGAFAAQMAAKNIPCSEVQDQRWGKLIHLTLPGGSKLGVYQPKHVRPGPALAG